MKIIPRLLGLAALATIALDARLPASAADLDHVYLQHDVETVLGPRPRRHRTRVVEEVVVEAPVPVPVYPPPPYDGPYGRFTYFPTHAPNYGYGY